MQPKINLNQSIISPQKLGLFFIILAGLVSSCGRAQAPTPVAEDTPVQTSVTSSAQTFSSDPLGLCFSFPLGYTQIPYNDTVEIVGPEIQGTDLRGLFWLEKSDPSGRTAQQVADQELAEVAGLNAGRSTVMLGGEQALVLDGMPGQDLVRRVYIVHSQTLYILTFSPTRSQNKAAGDQMEALYTEVTNSWAWSPCLANK